MAEPNKDKKKYFNWVTFWSVSAALIMTFIVIEVGLRRGTDKINKMIDTPKQPNV